MLDSESFLESNSPDILALCEANLENSIDTSNLSVRSYLPLIQLDSVSYRHDLKVYVKEGLTFAPNKSLENFQDAYVLDLLYFIWCITSFSLIDH